MGENQHDTNLLVFIIYIGKLTGAPWCPSILFTQKQPSPNSFRMNRTQKTGYADQ